MRADPGLETAVTAFVESLAPVMERTVARLPAGRPDKARDDVVVEAYNLSCGFIDADGRATDDELWSLIQTFAPRLDIPLLRASPDDLRRGGLIEGRRAFLATPSTMFEILLAVDARDGSAHAKAYYDLALDIGYTIASVDLHTSGTELDTIEGFRGALLDAMRRPAPPSGDEPGPPVAAGAAQGPVPASATTVAASNEDPQASAPEVDLDDLLDRLDALIGMEEVKQEVKRVTALIRVQNLRRARHLPVAEHSRHLIFTGNPGTGKTTVARLLSQIYRALGVVAKGHLVETDRAGLVAGYVGQTAGRVTEVFDRADQGVLLIDEAYALARGSDKDFGREAIDTIVKLTEDRRDRIVVIAAGYPDEMRDFVEANPGLPSRFPKTIEFPDYSTSELLEIFDQMCEQAHYMCDSEARQAVMIWLDAQPRGKGFGNGRVVRNLFEAAVSRQAERVVGIEAATDEQLVGLTRPDIPEPEQVRG